MVKEDIEGILGGLKNALERGNDFEKAKMTFLNAGYAQEDIDEAAKLLPENLKKAAKPALPAVPILRAEAMKGKPLPEILKPAAIKPRKHIMKTLLILTAIVVFILILILIGAMFL